MSNSHMVKQNIILPELFYLGFVVLLATLTLSHTLFNEYFPKGSVSILRIGCYFILILFMLLNTKSYSFVLNKMLLYFMFAVLSLIAFYYSNAYYILDLLVLGTASMIVDFRTILKIYIFIQVTLVLITFFCYFMGIFPDQNFGTRVNLFGIVSSRKSLGFAYTTLSVQIFFYVNLAYLYLRQRAITTIDLSILILLNLYLYNETGTRNAFLLILFEVILLIILRINGDRRLETVLDHNSYIYIFFLIFAISYFIGSNYNNSSSFYVSINTITSGRAELTHTAFQLFPAKFFGNDLYTQYQQYLNAYNLDLAGSFLDSSYMQMFFNAGILYTAAFIALLTWVLRKAIISKNFYLVFILLFIAIHSSMDPQLFEFSYNIFILLIFRYFIEPKSEILKGEKLCQNT